MDEHSSETPEGSVSEVSVVAAPEAPPAPEDPTPPEVDSTKPAEAAAEKPPHAAKAPKPRRRFRRDPTVIRAYRSGLPIDGVVEKVIKGGYEVRVGRSRGFCPHSQMDLHRVERPEDFVGKKESFRITELRRGGEELILSRRALLEEARSEEAKAVRATLLEGAVMQGRVARIADFGAFVDLGAGVIGLVHVTELSHARVAHPSDAVHVGETVSARILKLDEAQGRISLSIKQAEEDPWVSAEKAFEVGQTVAGTVRRVADFGAFVEIRRGLEALAPAREFPPSAGGFAEGLTVGATSDWVILSLDRERRRMSVVPAPPGGQPAGPLSLEPGSRLAGRVQRVERFGVFVWLAPGQVGLVPTAWSGARSAAEAAQKFPEGKEVRVEVVEVLEQGRRIRLAIEGVPRQAPQEKPRRESPPKRGRDERDRRDGAREEKERSEPSSPAPASFGTSLGDALRAAFDKKDADR